MANGNISDLVQVGSRIAKLRNALGLTQGALAERLGVSQNAVARWEVGLRDPGRPTIIAIGSVCGASVDWIANGNGQMLIHAAVVGGAEAVPTANVELQVFSGPPAFGMDGETLVSQDNALCLPLRRGVLEPLIERMGAGSLGTLCLVRAPEDDSMRPLVAPGNLVLVNTALGLRNQPVDGGLYLIQVDGEIRFRRIFVQDPVVFQGVTAAPDNPAARVIPVCLSPSEFPEFILGMACL